MPTLFGRPVLEGTGEASDCSSSDCSSRLYALDDCPSADLHVASFRGVEGWLITIPQLRMPIQGRINQNLRDKHSLGHGEMLQIQSSMR